MKDYLKLMRPKHYIKNVLIMLPLFFSGSIIDMKLVTTAIIAFIAFSLSASFVYVINDINDKEKDSKHEKKKNRPIASGRISVLNAYLFSVLLLIVSNVILFSINSNYLGYIYLNTYVFLNILYSYGLKNIPLLDITILVSGFLIRVLFGAAIINVFVSNWLYLTVIAASFYLSLGKRRNEIIKSGSKSREVLKYYTKEFLDKNMYMCLSLTIVFYSLWCVDPSTILKVGSTIIWTVPIIILILMKYSMNVEGDSYGDPVDVILGDKVLISLIFIYGLIIFGMLYVPVLF